MRAAVAFALLIVGCDGTQDQPSPTSEWTLGPTISGRKYSTGTITGSTITLGEVHYVTRPGTAPITSVSFHLDAPLTGAKCGTGTASLYFQRKGDDWQTDGNRWWSGTTVLDHAGDYTLTAGKWTSVQTMTQDNAPQAFADAKANIESVGFTLGNCEGLGHGAVGPATLTITDWRIGV